VLGPGAWLISHGEVPAAQAGTIPVTALALGDSRLAPFRPEIEAWLAAHGADAVLVRADRHVFGTGGAGDLVQAFRSAARHEPQPAALAAS
jgi:3-(3-hydroxy-phenyl)propionate hydroxylase